MACFNHGQIDVATERMSRSFEVLSQRRARRRPGDARGAQLGALPLPAGRRPRRTRSSRSSSRSRSPRRCCFPVVLSDALNTKGLIVNQRGQPEEGLALMRTRSIVALENDRPKHTLRAYFNLAVPGRLPRSHRARRAGARRAGARARAAARQPPVGGVVRRAPRARIATSSASGTASTGPLDELLERGWDDLVWSLRLDFAGLFVPVDVARGRLDEAREIARARAGPSARRDARTGRRRGRPRCPRERRTAATTTRSAARRRSSTRRGPSAPTTRTSSRRSPARSRRRSALGDLSAVEPIFERVRALQPVAALAVRRRTAGAVRRARGCPGRRREAADSASAARPRVQREVDARFWLAVTLLEHGEWLERGGTRRRGRAAARPRRARSSPRSTRTLARAAGRARAGGR